MITLLNSKIHNSSPQVQILNGRNYLVASATMIVPGILNGSGGAGYYSAEENAKSVQAWNGMPITVNHPKEGVSARDPQVINAQGIGNVYNASIENGNLKGEIWVDIEVANSIDSTIVDTIQNGKTMEVSTGLGLTQTFPEDKTTAVFNGESYDWIATNYEPDHLAFLPDQIGACSVSAGCGVNNAKGPTVDSLWTKLDEQLVQKYTNNANQYLWIREIFTGDNTVIYSLDGDLYETSFTIADEKVTISSLEPKRVVRKTTYVSVSNSNEGEKAMNLNAEQKSKAIDGLIANCDCWKESDRELLNNMSDDQITRHVVAQTTAIQNAKTVEAVQNGVKFGDKEFKLNSNHEFEEVKKEEPKKSVENAEPLTAKDWLEAAPAEIRSAVENAMQIEGTAKNEIINKLVAALPEDKKEERRTYLNSKDLSELKIMEELIPTQNAVPQQRHMSVSGAFTGQAPTAPIANSSDDDSEPLVPILLNYEQEQEV